VAGVIVLVDVSSLFRGGICVDILWAARNWSNRKSLSSESVLLGLTGIGFSASFGIGIDKSPVTVGGLLFEDILNLEKRADFFVDFLVVGAVVGAG